MALKDGVICRPRELLFTKVLLILSKRNGLTFLVRPFQTKKQTTKKLKTP